LDPSLRQALAADSPIPAVPPTIRIDNPLKRPDGIFHSLIQQSARELLFDHFVRITDMLIPCLDLAQSALLR